MTQTQSSRPQHRPEPVELEALEAVYRDLPVWGPLLVVAIAIALDVALPNKLRLGPRWLLPGLEALLLVGLVAASPSRRARNHRRRRAVVLTLIALVSATNAVSLALLVHYLVSGGHETGKDLIFSGALLWMNNVLLFGLWYWELDRGGLPVRVVHQLHGVQPDGHDAAYPDGQVVDGGAVAGCADHGRTGRCSRREHSRVMRVR
jgi:uncharacterized membrane protein